MGSSSMVLCLVQKVEIVVIRRVFLVAGTAEHCLFVGEI